MRSASALSAAVHRTAESESARTSRSTTRTRSRPRRRRPYRRPRPAHYLAPSAPARCRRSAVRPSGRSGSLPALSGVDCAVARLARRFPHVCTEAGRDVALLTAAQRHHAAVGGGAAARRPARLRDTRGARCSARLDLAMAYMQFYIREEYQHKTSFRVPGGRYEFRVGAFSLHGMSPVRMRSMHSIFGRCALSFDSIGQARPGGPDPLSARRALACSLCRCAATTSSSSSRRARSISRTCARCSRRCGTTLSTLT